jgi:hypothetical protein
LGLALWVAKGMAGWMKQWSRLAEATVGLPKPAVLAQAPAGGAWQQQLTMLLAQMTLGHLQAQDRL